MKKSCCSPAWNEQIVFTEMFPPLCQRIKLQLRDNGPVKDSVIATHFIDISKVSAQGQGEREGAREEGEGANARTHGDGRGGSVACASEEHCSPAK